LEKIPKKIGENLARFSKKFSKILAKFAKFCKNQQNFQQQAPSGASPLRSEAPRRGA